MEYRSLKEKDSLNLEYIYIKGILVIYAVLILPFVLPSLVLAEENQELAGNIVDAEVYMNVYRSISLRMIEEEEYPEFEVVEPDYNTDCNYYLYSGYYSFYEKPAQKVWRHALDLYRKGLIHGANPNYQCTFFAQMWFYDIYGFNSTGNRASGNGKDLAYRIYQTNVYYDEEGNLQHYFELSSKPKSLSILSISGISESSGHVICIDEVDYENNTITFSDGNVTNSGDVRIRITMDIDEFYRENPGRYVFATPTLELLQMCGYQ